MSPELSEILTVPEKNPNLISSQNVKSWQLPKILKLVPCQQNTGTGQIVSREFPG